MHAVVLRDIVQTTRNTANGSPALTLPSVSTALRYTVRSPVVACRHSSQTRALSSLTDAASRQSVASIKITAPGFTGTNAIASTSAIPLRILRRNSSNTVAAAANMAKFPTPSLDPPKNEMYYFPNMTTSLPSESGDFRRVLFTGLYSQLVLMTVPVDGEIGDEKHTVDQILTFTSGQGRATIAGKDQDVKAGDLIIVPAGTQHQFINTGPTPLILYTVYSPAEHKPTSVHKDKEQGDREEEEGIDVPPEWSQRSKAENEKLGLVEGE